MTPIEEWIRSFLKRYAATVGPHDFPDGSDPDEVLCFVEGWIEAFGRVSPPITEAEADAARKRLALHRPRFRGDHLPAVVEVVRGFRERDDAAAMRALLEQPDPAGRVAAIRSHGCPECTAPGGTGPTGLARRKGVWCDRSWSATATLYCRCTLGRLRLSREAMDPLPFDDLQAMPHLWDPSLSHASWSDRPVPPPSVEGRGWRYVLPGESAPPAPAKALRLGPPIRPRREWAGRVPDNLIMPRLARVEPEQARAADEACEGEDEGRAAG